MCPHMKLKWFKKHGYTATQMRDLKKLVLNRWDQSYKPASANAPNVSIPLKGKVRVYQCKKNFVFTLSFRPDQDLLLISPMMSPLHLMISTLILMSPLSHILLLRRLVGL